MRKNNYMERYSFYVSDKEKLQKKSSEKCVD